MKSKSEVAFLLSCEKLFATNEKIYLWTFTFKKVLPDWYYPRAWSAFIHDLQQNYYGGFLQGLRVLEIHPGGHGLHYHALLNKRIPVDLVRKVKKKYGFGRDHVIIANVRSGQYLAKYLTKRNGELYPGMRRWGTVGSFKQVRKNDIEIDSMFHRNIKIIGQGKQIPYKQTRVVFSLSRLHGEYRDWPYEAIAKVHTGI